MLQQLMWIEVLLKGGLGLILALMPGHAARLAGLPVANPSFWPRLCGAILLGIAAGLLLQGHLPTVRAIPPAGLITINLTVAGMLVALLVLGQAAETWRGRALLWLLAIGLAALTTFEIQFA